MPTDDEGFSEKCSQKTMLQTYQQARAWKLDNGRKGNSYQPGHLIDPLLHPEQSKALVFQLRIKSGPVVPKLKLNLFQTDNHRRPEVPGVSGLHGIVQS